MNPGTVASRIGAEISRIEALALSLGWRRDRLWSGEFWPSSEQPRGLPSILEPGDRLVEVESAFMTIEKHDGKRLRFRRE